MNIQLTARVDDPAVPTWRRLHALAEQRADTTGKAVFARLELRQTLGCDSVVLSRSVARLRAEGLISPDSDARMIQLVTA